jgi:protein associated with RNAse G/E
LNEHQLACQRDADAIHSLITVQSRKYDERIHRHWRARVIEQTGSMLVLDATFAEEIRHPLLGTIAPGTLSAEYYWTDRWYSIFRFSEPHGALRNFYCNINMPAIFDGEILSFVDLDIDVLVMPDFSYRILDEDEFAVNTARFNYPADIQSRAQESLASLIELIEERCFPFNLSA